MVTLVLDDRVIRHIHFPEASGILIPWSHCGESHHSLPQSERSQILPLVIKKLLSEHLTKGSRNTITFSPTSSRRQPLLTNTSKDAVNISRNTIYRPMKSVKHLPEIVASCKHHLSNVKGIVNKKTKSVLNTTRIIFQLQDQFDPLPHSQIRSGARRQVDDESSDFISFSRLPPEIQLKIWRYAAIPQPRIMELEPICKRDRNGFLLNHDIQYRVPTKYLPIPLLGVCYQSRAIALENYKYAKFLEHPLLYNTDKDILWIRGNPIFMVIHNSTPNLITYGCLEALFWQRRRDIGPYRFRSVALDFAGIKKHYKKFPVEANMIGAYYAVSRLEVEKVHIVYSSRDRRSEVDGVVQRILDEIEELRGHQLYFDLHMRHLKEKNELDGTRLTEWIPPPIEAILDTAFRSNNR